MMPHPSLRPADTVTDRKPVVQRDKPLGAFPWHINDYRASRAMNALDHVGRGMMRELFDEIWREGWIPDDIETIAEIARVPAGVAGDQWPRLRKLFTPLDGTDGHLLTHRRVEIERTEADRQRVKRQRAGRLGGLAKGGNKSDPDQLDLASLSNAKHSAKHPRKEGSERREEVVALGASIVGTPIAPALCPFCVGRALGHDPVADCTPRRISSAERAS